MYILTFNRIKNVSIVRSRRWRASWLQPCRWGRAWSGSQSPSPPPTPPTPSGPQTAPRVWRSPSHSVKTPWRQEPDLSPLPMWTQTWHQRRTRRHPHLVSRRIETRCRRLRSQIFLETRRMKSMLERRAAILLQLGRTTRPRGNPWCRNVRENSAPCPHPSVKPSHLYHSSLVDRAYHQSAARELAWMIYLHRQEMICHRLMQKSKWLINFQERRRKKPKSQNLSWRLCDLFFLLFFRDFYVKNV